MVDGVGRGTRHSLRSGLKSILLNPMRRLSHSLRVSAFFCGFLASAQFQVSAGRVPSVPIRHTISDAKADIRDLDVGDLSDMESDVSPVFFEELQKTKTKTKPTVPTMSDMTNPMDWVTSAQSGMGMTFATLTMQKSEELGKEGTEQLARQWKSMLEAGGVSAQVYSIDPGRILFTTSGAGSVGQIKNFVLSQDDVDWFEYNQQRMFPAGRTSPLMDHDARKRREAELGWRSDPSPPKRGKVRKKRRAKSKEL